MPLAGFGSHALRISKISKILFSSLEIRTKAKASHVRKGCFKTHCLAPHTNHCCWAHLPAHCSLSIRAPGSKGEPWQPDGNVLGARTLSRSSKSFVSIRLIMRATRLRNVGIASGSLSVSDQCACSIMQHQATRTAGDTEHDAGCASKTTLLAALLCNNVCGRGKWKPSHTPPS